MKDAWGVPIGAGDTVVQINVVDPDRGALEINARRRGTVLRLNKSRVVVDFGREKLTGFGRRSTGEPALDRVGPDYLQVIESKAGHLIPAESVAHPGGRPAGWGLEPAPARKPAKPPRIKAVRQDGAMPNYELTDPNGGVWTTYERSFLGQRPPLWWLATGRSGTPPIGWHLFGPDGKYVNTFRRLYEVKAKVLELWDKDR